MPCKAATSLSYLRTLRGVVQPDYVGTCTAHLREAPLPRGLCQLDHERPRLGSSHVPVHVGTFEFGRYLPRCAISTLLGCKPSEPRVMCQYGRRLWKCIVESAANMYRCSSELQPVWRLQSTVLFRVIQQRRWRLQCSYTLWEI